MKFHKFPDNMQIRVVGEPFPWYYAHKHQPKKVNMPPSPPSGYNPFSYDSTSRSPAEDQLRMKVLQLEGIVQQQNELLGALGAPPYVRFTVLAMGRPEEEIAGPTGKTSKIPGMILVGNGGQELEIPLPPQFKVKVGDVVRINPKTLTFVEKVADGEATPNGVIQVVAGLIDKNNSEIESGGGRRVIHHTMAVEKGDRVMLDPGGNHVLRNLGKQMDNFQADTERINITWDDVGGQHRAKEEMREAIEGPVVNREIFEAYGKKAVKGILLYGPPGCGKTLLAKAAARSLADLHGAKSASGFIYVKGPEILNKWVGQSEETIRSLFARARDHHKREGYPAVLFIDEADAILGARGTQSMVTGMEKTIVPMFLAEMDGLDENGPLVLLSTNRPDALDAAVVRDGRVDRKIEVVRPSQDDSVEIFTQYLRGKPIATLANIAYATGFAQAVFANPTLKSRVSGALIAGLVDQAVSIAMRRDIASGNKKPTGLLEEDIQAACKVVETQNLKVKNG